MAAVASLVAGPECRTDMLLPAKIPAVLLSCLVASALLANAASVAPAAPRRRQYAPIFAPKYKPSEKYALKTLKGDFSWAAESPTLPVAAYRWRTFLARYAGPDRELEDGFDALRINVAKYELMRVYYLLGKAKEGDQLLEQLDPLKLRSEGASMGAVRGA